MKYIYKKKLKLNFCNTKNWNPYHNHKCEYKKACSTVMKTGNYSLRIGLTKFFFFQNWNMVPNWGKYAHYARHDAGLVFEAFPVEIQTQLPILEEKRSQFQYKYRFFLKDQHLSGVFSGLIRPEGRASRTQVVCEPDHF